MRIVHQFQSAGARIQVLVDFYCCRQHARWERSKAQATESLLHPVDSHNTERRLHITMTHRSREHGAPDALGVKLPAGAVVLQQAALCSVPSAPAGPCALQAPPGVLLQQRVRGGYHAWPTHTGTLSAISGCYRQLGHVLTPFQPQISAHSSKAGSAKFMRFRALQSNPRMSVAGLMDRASK